MNLCLASKSYGVVVDLMSRKNLNVNHGMACDLLWFLYLGSSE